VFMIIFLVLFGVLFTAYILFLLYAIRILRQVQDPLPPGPVSPVSIIITMHNAEQNVRACLEHVQKQDYPPDLIEIILVADRCSDDTEKIINTYIPVNPKIKLISIKRVDAGFAPKKFAIDTAVSQARGEIILLTDADGRPGPHWVKSMVSLFRNKTGMVIGYAPYSTDKPYYTFTYRLLALEYLSHAAVAAVTTALRYPLTCVGTNLAYRKCVYEQLGGFGKYKSFLSGDDDLFLQRVREESDWTITYAPVRDAHVPNAPPRTFSQFYQQRLRYASKGFLYPFWITFTLICFYLLNLMILLLGLSLLCYPPFTLTLLTILIIKIITEYRFLKQTAFYLNDTRHLKLLPLVSLFHVPYVVYFGLASQLQKYRWAGMQAKVR
jgi:cellulose synthase/poly-beta-1,6-N-acetylglucosamine synthase-like glycosyltransferase